MIKTSYLKVIRKKSCLTQEEVAEQIGVGVATYRRWEYGEFEPKARNIKKLCEVLGCSESELLNGPQATVRRFELILDPDDEFQMEVVNMTDTAVEHKSLSVSTKRIGLALNINTAGMTKKAVKELMLQTFDEVFNNAWESHLRMRKSEA